MKNNEPLCSPDYGYWFDKKTWSLHEACYLINSLNPKSIIEEMPSRYYNEVNGVKRRFCETYRTYNSYYNNELVLKNGSGSKDLDVNPPLFIEWAHSEGYSLPDASNKDGSINDFFISFTKDELKRELIRHEFGRYKKFYKEWANRGYWTSNQALSLLQNKDPNGDIFCGGEYQKGIPAINGGYNYYVQDMGTEMKCDTAAGKLKLLIANQPEDIFAPKDVIEWAKCKGYDIPEHLLEAVELVATKNTTTAESRNIQKRTSAKHAFIKYLDTYANEEKHSKKKITKEQALENFILKNLGHKGQLKHKGDRFTNAAWNDFPEEFKYKNRPKK